jgi:hypothetical protein
VGTGAGVLALRTKKVSARAKMPVKVWSFSERSQKISAEREAWLTEERGKKDCAMRKGASNLQL